MNARDREALAKQGIVAGLRLVNPKAATVAQVLITVFWPSDRDVWSEIREEVEKLVDQKIEELAYNQADAALTGFKKQLNRYGDKVREGPLEPIRTSYESVETIFTGDIEKFRVKSFEVLLLPFFAQAATMHLSVLHDAATHGPAWGMDAKTVDGARKRRDDLMKEYRDYIASTINAGAEKIKNNAGRNLRQSQPFRDVNKFRRDMALFAGDYADLWSNFHDAK